MTSTEAQAWGAYAASFFWHVEDSYLQYHRGTLDAASWATDLATPRGFLRAPA